MMEQIIENRFREELAEFQRLKLGMNTPELSLHEKVLVFCYTKFLWEGMNETLR